MKQYKTRIFSVFLIFSMLLTIQVLNPNVVPVKSAGREINVQVHYGVELITIMQMLGGYTYTTKPYDFAYRKEVLDYFNPYKGQPSIAKIMGFMKNTTPRDTAIVIPLYLSQVPELKNVIPYPASVIERAGGQSVVNEFIAAMKSFATNSNFMKFIEKHKSFYQTIEDQTKKELKPEQYLRQMEDYYGIKQHSYNIILASFIQCGGFGPRINREDNTQDIFSIIGPCGMTGDLPNFGDKKYFEGLIFHEFSHSFVNPLTEFYDSKVKACNKLYNPISQEMDRMRYGEWTITLNEHLIRTFTARIAEFNKSPEEAKKEMEADMKYGFVYMPILLEQFKIYEKSRDKYKTFKEFYSVLLDYLITLSTYPSIPTKFEINITGEGEIGLKWQDNAYDEKGYRVYRSVEETGHFDLLTEVPKNTAFYEDGKIETGKTYWYKVSSFNNEGEMETPVLSKEAPLVVPKNVKEFHLESAKGQTVNLAWVYETICQGFILYEMPGKIEIQRLTKTDRTVQLSKVSFGEHKYQLFAYNEWDSKQKLSREKEMVTASVLEPPSNVKGKALRMNSIELVWMLSNEAIDKIEVFRRSGDQEFQLIKELGKVVQFVDEKLEVNTEYEYKLMAKKGTLIRSDESESIKIRTEAKKEPEPPKIEIITLRFQIGNKKYWVNTEQKDMDVAPINKDGRMFLPIRYVTSSIGAEIEWDAKELKTTIRLEQTTIELWIGKNIARINGVDKPIDATNPNIKPINLSGRTFLPLRFVGESLGCELKWDAKAQEATLIYKKVG